MIKRFLPYLKEFKRNAILAPVLIFFEVVCELIMPLLMARIIDDGIEGGLGLPVILPCGIALILLSFLSMYCGVGSAKHSAIASQGFGRNLRGKMFETIQSFSFADIDRFSSASLITRITNDVTALQQTLAMSLRMLVRAPSQMLASLVVCLIINARLTIVLLVALPCMVLMVLLIMSKARLLFQRFQEKMDGLNDAVQENLVAIRVVKAFVRAPFEKKKFAKANDELYEAGINAVMLICSVFPIMMTFLNAATLLVLWFGGRSVTLGTMQTGELYSFFSYIAHVLISVFMVAICLLQITRASACGTRILEVLDTEPSIDDAKKPLCPERSGRVEFRHVSFRYKTEGSGDDVLHDINLTVEPGEFVAIVGATGTGKSTLVNLIPRFYDATEGSVLVDGQDVRDYSIEELRGRIGMVLQKNVLFSGTIRENLLWGDPDATEEQMIACAKSAQAHDFILSFPNGYDTYLEQGGVNVSGGQKQRLCIARAMLRHPSILILDDSTSAVDTVTEASIRKSFKEDLQGTTVILIAQRISSVRNADRIIILDDDHVAGTGTHAELLENNEIYREICRSQQEGGLSNG